ncbi:MAG: HzsA-related protein [Thermoguttaceae bacterium]
MGAWNFASRAYRRRMGRLSAILLLALAASVRAEPYSEQIEQDWLRQADAWRKGKYGDPMIVTTGSDAAGAVDGVKNGLYAFHTGQQPNPWWQVDLGREQAIGRVVVWNRLDYAPGLHNADNLNVLTSLDGRQWTLQHENRRHFGGVSGAPPLEIIFPPAGIRARFVRLQIPSAAPIFLHLDEVEVFDPGNESKNLALKCPADQSSLSQWSVARDLGRKPVPMVFPTADWVRRAGAVVADLRTAGVDVSGLAKEVETTAAEIPAEPEAGTEAERRERYLRVRRLVRRLVFANPLLDFKDLLFVERFTQETYPDVCLNHMPWVSRPGGDLCVLTLNGIDGQPDVQPVLKGALGPGHVHGVDLHWDGSRIVFGYAKAKSNQPPEGWLDRRTNFDLRRTVEPIHLFEVKSDGSGLRQVTHGEWSDLDPTYAPNDDIVFVSERCGSSLQCNEYDKDETSCNLYVCRPNGSDIRQMSVSKDGDYLPHTLADGTIGYTRWEYQERGWANIQSIWFIRPDGTGADALFKQHLNDPWAIEDARSVPNSETSQLAAIACGHHTLAAGPVVVVTPSVAMNDPAAIRIVTPGVSPPEGGMSGTPVPSGGVDDHGGFYMHPWPLSDRHFLVSYCYGSQTDPTGYALYLIDVFGSKELIYRSAAISCFHPMPLRPRPRPPVLPDGTDRSLDYAVLSVADVMRGVEGIAPGQARYLRIGNRLQWPYDNTHGGSRFTEKAYPNNWTPVRILGTVPLDETGSACFKVPADTAVYFQLLDADGMELRRMRSFISFQPGESRGCIGCHETRAQAPVDTPFPASLVGDPLVPTPPPWGTRPLSFLRDVQPVFDRHCVGCHGGLKPAGGLDFSGGLTASPAKGPGYSTPVAGYGHNRAFETIIANKLVAWSDVNGDAGITQPLAQGSHKSRLVEVLRTGPCADRVQLTADDWTRLVTWIDANAPYHDRFVNKRPETPAYSLPDDRELLAEIAAVHARRCGSCHAPETVTRADWIDLQSPEKSLFLAAPLTDACGKAYASPDDADYRAVLELVKTAVEKTWRSPRRDVASLGRN